jgi:glycosyltransferase involved in cell wall biosynthesis
VASSPLLRSDRLEAEDAGMSGLISTIIPVYNRPGMLRQTYDRYEIIIVDDGSTDDTPHTIASLCSGDRRIRSVRRANGGPGMARETGRQAASGEFIQYLDSDDVLLPRKFELQVAALRAHPGAGISYGFIRYRDASGSEISCHWKEANQVQTAIFPSFLLARWWETVAPLYRRSATDAVGSWTELRLEEDWEYDCRFGALGISLAPVEEMVGEHRDHPEGRLSRGAGSDPGRLRDRTRAHECITAHARRAGIDAATPEFQHFARELFHIGRQCGAAGLADESERLVTLAGELTTSRDVRLYATVARAIGWRNAGRIAALLDRWR